MEQILPWFSCLNRKQSCPLTFIIILLTTSADEKLKSTISSGSCVFILQSVRIPPSSASLQLNKLSKKQSPRGVL